MTHRRGSQAGRERRQSLATALLLAALIAAFAPAEPAAAQPAPVTIHRVFLKDGTPLVSYGEYTRAGDRVVFTIPLGSASQPDAFQVVGLPVDAIDWDKTSGYADTARFQNYVATRGDTDYNALTAEVARALAEISLSTDGARKLAVAQQVRAMLVAWPRTHFGYRSAEVRDLTMLLDEAISEVQAQMGQNSFSFDLVAVLEPPPGELLPDPSLEESIALSRAAARALDSPAERMSLQQAILSVLSARERELPARWVAAVRSELSTAMLREQRTTRELAEQTARVIATAARRSASGDVAGVARVLADARAREAKLEAGRADEMAALVGTLEWHLETARARRLELDRWEMRNRTYAGYRKSIDTAVAGLSEFTGDLEAIRSMSGPIPSRLPRLLDRLVQMKGRLAGLTPPADLNGAQSALVSSVALMEEAVRRRQDAIMAANREFAGHASAAAAGALLLLESARTSVVAFFQRPELR